MSDADSSNREPTDHEESDEHASSSARRTNPRARTVTVPLHIYKTITVFSTLFAILGVVLGFVLLDAATNRTQAPVEEIDPLVAAFGLLLIVAGAVVYAFSTRFQAEGMGNAKERSDEESDDG